MAKSERMLNQYLKYRRKELGLSQADVSKELGYSSPQFVSNWERGLVSPPMSCLPKLMVLFEIPRETLIDLVLKDTRKQLDGHLSKVPLSSRSVSAAR